MIQPILPAINWFLSLLSAMPIAIINLIQLVASLFAFSAIIRIMMDSR